jgi:ABC-type multidrug transport system ATPase subunit
VSVEARALTHRFGTRLALPPQSFTIEHGVAAITGPNGSGKSTLLRILSGLLRPSGGESRVTVGGRPVPPAARRTVAGLASPELSFYPDLTVTENLVFAAEARSLADPRAQVREALERVGLSDRAHDRVGALSSGLQQRVRLAFAALGDPPVIMLDEPGSHLDEAGRTALESWILAAGRTHLVLLATNDEREWRLAERRIQLNGRDLGDPA